MLKRLLPKTLFGRSLAIVATPLVLLQIVVAYVFYEAHWDTVTRRLALGLAGDISMVIQSLRDAPDPAGRERVLDLARSHFALDVTVLPQAVLPSGENQRRPFAILDRMLNQALGERLFRPFAINTRRSDNKIEIRVQLQEGVRTHPAWCLRFAARRAPRLPRPPWREQRNQAVEAGVAAGTDHRWGEHEGRAVGAAVPTRDARGASLAGRNAGEGRARGGPRSERGRDIVQGS